jgi:hypothetical protein
MWEQQNFQEQKEGSLRNNINNPGVGGGILSERVRIHLRYILLKRAANLELICGNRLEWRFALAKSGLHEVAVFVVVMGTSVIECSASKVVLSLNADT